MYTDVNALLGHWPFRKIRKPTLEDLRSVHRDNGITGGYVSSINAIFYNDPFEGDEELHELIGGTEYRHVLTVNPTLPGWQRDIEEGLERFGIHGVRVYPTYHDYDLNGEAMAELCETLKRFRLPLFLTMRMEDERLDYLMKPNPLNIESLRTFVSAWPELDVIVLTIRYAEIAALKEEFNRLPRLRLDTSGLKDRVFVLEDLLTFIPAGKIVYGSLHPLFCLKSTFCLVDMAELAEETKRAIFAENARFLQRSGAD
jgi:hypothetical protein